jgi:hypothetical protein
VLLFVFRNLFQKKDSAAYNVWCVHVKINTVHNHSIAEDVVAFSVVLFRNWTRICISIL